MGTAFRARSAETGQICVLKTCDFRERPKSALFFVREVQMGLKLRHPNIVPIVDFGESGGLLYLAMEFVDGGSLLDRMEQGPLAWTEALDQLLQLAGALDYAGGRKFVHRDIKPANILLTSEGVPKLADFGLAKLLSETRFAPVTLTGEARGTPVYMAPETIAHAADADARADLYSLGATYYHALAGQPPFTSRSLPEVFRMVASAEPEPLEARNPEVPAALAAVIRRTMRKDRAERYQSGAELALDLERVARPAAVRRGA
jgi:serine/threonine protein kinase